MSIRGYTTDGTVSDDDVLMHWRWLVDESLTVWMVTQFGDAFLTDSEGAVHWLNTVDGELELVAGSREEFERIASDAEVAERWFMTDVVDGQRAVGRELGEGECWSFKMPPSLGGELEPANLEASTVAEHFGVTGQLHRQLRELTPAGVPIGGGEAEAEQADAGEAAEPGRAADEGWRGEGDAEAVSTESADSAGSAAVGAELDAVSGSDEVAGSETWRGAAEPADAGAETGDGAALAFEDQAIPTYADRPDPDAAAGGGAAAKKRRAWWRFWSRG